MCESVISCGFESCSTGLVNHQTKKSTIGSFGRQRASLCRTRYPSRKFLVTTRLRRPLHYLWRERGSWWLTTPRTQEVRLTLATNTVPGQYIRTLISGPIVIINGIKSITVSDELCYVHKSNMKDSNQCPTPKRDIQMYRKKKTTTTRCSMSLF